MADQKVEEPKALPVLAEWYALRHQAEQESIAAKVVAGLLLLWPTLPFDDLFGKAYAGWLHGSTLQVEWGWRQSVVAAARFVEAARWAVEPELPELPVVEQVFPVVDVQTALKVTGPVRVAQLVARARPEVEALKAGEVGSSGAGATKATDGGRAQVLELIRRDAPGRLRQGKVIGYARKTDNDPCYFCALLASQGAVYFTESSFAKSNSMIREVKWTSNKDKGVKRAFIGDGPAKVHDNCQCTMRPVYRKADSRDERAKYFLDQWNAAGGMKDYRNNYKPPPPYSADVLDLNERRKLIADVQRNRDALIARGFAAGSPNVKFLDRSIRELEAV